MKHRLPETLAADVRSELARLGGSPQGGQGLIEITAAWSGCVGSTIAGNAWPARFARDGTLIVHASSSAWAFELGHLEGMIRDRLGQLAPARLKFVVGAVPSPGPESVPRGEKPLHRGTPESRARAVELAGRIEDPALRELVARAAAASLAKAPERPGPTGASGRLGNG